MRPKVIKRELLKVAGPDSDADYREVEAFLQWLLEELADVEPEPEDEEQT